MFGRTAAAPPSVLALMGVLVLTGTLLAAAVPVMAAVPRACRVTNLDTGRSTASLQRAVRAASRGDRIIVRGVCRGATVIGKDLVVRGEWGATSGRPVLDGARTGTVLTIRAGALVTIRDLTVRHGAASRGGGIRNRGTLVLQDVVVRASTASEDGGGIYNDAGAVLRVRGSSVVRGNTAAEWGGGIRDLGALWLAGSSTIRGNSADMSGGGVAISWMGTMVMKGSSSITGNTAVGASVFTAVGGGVWTNGMVMMRGSSVISDNSSARLGGGVHVAEQGSLAMRDSSSIHDNEAIDGGGVYSFGGSLDGLRMPPDANPNVYDNIPDDCRVVEPIYGDADAEAADGTPGNHQASDPDPSISQPVGTATPSDSTCLGMPRKNE